MIVEGEPGDQQAKRKHGQPPVAERAISPCQLCRLILTGSKTLRIFFARQFDARRSFRSLDIHTSKYTQKSHAKTRFALWKRTGLKFMWGKLIFVCSGLYTLRAVGRASHRQTRLNPVGHNPLLKERRRQSMETLNPMLAAAFYVVGTAYYAVALWLMLDDRRKNRH